MIPSENVIKTLRDPKYARSSYGILAGFLSDIERWSIDSYTPVGQLGHLRPTVQLAETKPYWACPSFPLGHNQPA
jgi:hypothetical protein